MSKGWVYLHRSIFESPFYFSEKFTKSQAWIDLLLLANHSKGYIGKRGHLIEVPRGYVGYSKLALSKRWRWSETKTDKFLKDLTKMGQIREQKIHKITTLLQILNYDKYQQKKEQTGEQTGEQKADRKGTESGQKRTNKELKELNKEKERGRRKPKAFTPPSIDDVKKYFSESGYSETSALRFYNGYDVSNWIDTQGTKIKNWKQKAIHVWFKPENEIKKTSSSLDALSLDRIFETISDKLKSGEFTIDSAGKYMREQKIGSKGEAYVERKLIDQNLLQED